MRGHFRRLMFSFALLLAAPLAPVSAAPAAARTTATINGIAYVEARTFLSRYGLNVATSDATGRKVTISSAWTKVGLEADKRECTLNGRRLFLGEAVALRSKALYLAQSDAEKIFAPILRPSGIANPTAVRVIALDAGHGGNDSGTRSAAFKLDEKDLALDVAKRLQKRLTTAGYQVVMTRTDDRYIELEERAAIANRAGADLFISIHFNSAGDAASVTGTETYALSPVGQRSTSSDERAASDRIAQPGNAHDPWNSLIAWQVHRRLIENLQTFDRGVKRARFAVLKYVKCPGVLVEAGYLSSPGEAKKIGSAAYREDIAESLAQAVNDYDTAVRTALK